MALALTRPEIAVGQRQRRAGSCWCWTPRRPCPRAAPTAAPASSARSSGHMRDRERAALAAASSSRTPCAASPPHGSRIVRAALATLERIKPGVADQPRFPDVATSCERRGRRAGTVHHGRSGWRRAAAPSSKQSRSSSPSTTSASSPSMCAPVPGNPRRYEAFVEVLNASSGNKRVELRVSGTGAKAITRTLQLAGALSRQRSAGCIRLRQWSAARYDRQRLRWIRAGRYRFRVFARQTCVRVGLVTRGNQQLATDPRTASSGATHGAVAGACQRGSRSRRSRVRPLRAPRRAAPAGIADPSPADELVAASGRRSCRQWNCTLGSSTPTAASSELARYHGGIGRCCSQIRRRSDGAGACTCWRWALATSL